MELFIFVFISLICVWNGYSAFRNKNYYYAFLILIFLFTDGFNIAPHSSGFLIYSNVGIILSVLFLYEGKLEGIIFFRKNGLEKQFTNFGLYFILCVLFSIFHYEFAPNEVVRVMKWLFPFWSIYLFRLLSKQDFQRLMHTLLVITIWLNVFYIIQALFNVSLFADKSGGAVIGFVHRYYNKPIMSTFFLYYLFFGNPSLNSFNRKISIIVLSFALLLSFNRIEIAAVVIGYCFCSFIHPNANKRMKRMALLPLLLIPVLFALQLRDESESSFANERSSRGDIESIMHGDFVNYNNGAGLSSGGTMTFRVAMLYERIEYMAKECSLPEIAMGLGLGHSDYDKVYRLYKFKIGTNRIKEGGMAPVSQLASADMAWVEMLCQWGVIGMLIFCYIFYQMYRFFIINKKNVWSLICCGYLVYLFFNSWAGSFPVQSSFYILPFMAYYRIMKNKHMSNVVKDLKFRK